MLPSNQGVAGQNGRRERAQKGGRQGGNNGAGETGVLPAPPHRSAGEANKSARQGANGCEPSKQEARSIKVFIFFPMYYFVSINSKRRKRIPDFLDKLAEQRITERVLLNTEGTLKGCGEKLLRIVKTKACLEKWPQILFTERSSKVK